MSLYIVDEILNWIGEFINSCEHRYYDFFIGWKGDQNPILRHTTSFIFYERCKNESLKNCDGYMATGSCVYSENI